MRQLPALLNTDGMKRRSVICDHLHGRTENPTQAAMCNRVRSLFCDLPPSYPTLTIHKPSCVRGKPAHTSHQAGSHASGNYSCNEITRSSFQDTFAKRSFDGVYLLLLEISCDNYNFDQPEICGANARISPARVRHEARSEVRSDVVRVAIMSRSSTYYFSTKNKKVIQTL